MDCALCARRWRVCSFSVAVTAVILLCTTGMSQADGVSVREECDTSVSSDCAPVCTQVVLVGANGDLAKRYLWQAVFDLYMHQVQLADLNSDGVNMLAVSGTRKTMVVGDLHQLVLGSIQCDSVQALTQVKCDEVKGHFLGHVVGWKLKDAGDYQELATHLQEHARNAHCTSERRLFYLAIPAFAFESTAGFIGKLCRPTSQNGASWVRVVFEKPFGHDYTSAKELVDSVRAALRDDEILLIDHYLGKTGVMLVQQLRTMGFPRNQLWSNLAVSQVNINVEETLDAAGRTGFYDSYGVVRDMLQNHLTSILLLLTCQLDTRHGCSAKSHLEVLKSIEHVSPAQVVLGQYESYQDHVCADKPTQCGIPSRTATFASVLLHLSSNQWRSVPFVLTSGKAMTDRHASVTLHLNPKTVPLLSCQNPRVFINIQGGVHGTSLLIPAELSQHEATLPDGWHWSGYVSLDNCVYQIATTAVTVRPYSQLLRVAASNPDGHFVDAASLLESWRAWSPVLELLPYLPLKLYSPASVEAGFMKSRVSMKSLHLAAANEIRQIDNAFGLAHGKQLLGAQLFVDELDRIIIMVIQDIVRQALEAIDERGSFHLALPGGSSPRPLLVSLASSTLADAIPWRLVHIWQVDERCVNPVTDSQHSNFIQLSRLLLQHRPILAENIHQMPVSLSNGFCSSGDDGCGAYSAQLSMYNGAILDSIVLGVGMDGHVASLFEHTQTSSVTNDVAITEQDRALVQSRRMTLTYNTLNRARSVSFIVLGSAKADIVQQLKGTGSDVPALPAAVVSTQRTGNTTWYIDKLAYPD